jgi:hypothetical protein
MGSPTLQTLTLLIFVVCPNPIRSGVRELVGSTSMGGARVCAV